MLLQVNSLAFFSRYDDQYVDKEVLRETRRDYGIDVFRDASCLPRVCPEHIRHDFPIFCARLRTGSGRYDLQHGF